METTLEMSKKNEKTDYSLLVDTAILLGEIMLKNGAETNRVEKNMDKLLRTTKMKHIEAVVMTTSITVTLSDPSIEHITAVSRIHERTTNLNRVNLANDLINKYCNNQIDLEELFHELKKLKKLKQYNHIISSIALVLVAPAFTAMLNGGIREIISAFICAVSMIIVNKLFSYIIINNFIKNCIIMMMTSFLAVLLNKYVGSNIQEVVVGFIMPYVPGVAITNAARDTFNADYMSGAARLLDALVQAVDIALGVYVGLLLGNLLFK